jgi:sec-independent protein translocase protein TatC
MVSLMLPLFLLYELSIWSCRFVEKQRAQREAQEEAELAGKAPGE